MKLLNKLILALVFSTTVFADLTIDKDVSKYPTIKLDENNSQKIERILVKKKEKADLVKVEMVCKRKKGKYPKYSCKTVDLKSLK